jgi:hypothetical protein
LVFWGIWGGVQMFISGLQMCTNEITIVGIYFFLNFEYGGANVTDLALSCVNQFGLPLLD